MSSMGARGRLATSTATMPALSAFNRGLNEAPRGTRLATPLSSHKTGALLRPVGDGDGGIAAWKKSPAATTTNRQTAMSRLEKPTIASTLRAASNRSKVLAQKSAISRKPKPTFGGSGSGGGGGGGGGDEKQLTERVLLLGNASRQADRLGLQRRAAGGVAVLKKDNQAEDFREFGVEKLLGLDIGVQTNEAEILNRDLVVGDIKLLMPSPALAKQIDKDRLDTKKKMDQPILRKFSTHEQNEEQHLDELKEFMERSYVTRRVPKKPTMPDLGNYELKSYGNAFRTMDEFFTREIPRAESITNIKDRIRRKEVELMSMFDDVDISDKIESDSDGE